MTFEKVFVRATDLLPQLAWRNSSAIHGWLEAGADAEKDIIPVIERLAAKNPTIGGFKYFTNAILKAKEEREQAARIIAKIESGVPQASDEVKARNIATCIRKFSRTMPQEERWLKEYEAKFGAVQI